MTPEHLAWVRDYLREIIQMPILENFLDLQIAEVTEGKVVYSTKIAEKHCNIYGVVHGGTLASLADVAMGGSCVTMRKRIVTIDMNTSYLKSVPAGSILTVVGEVISNGNTIMRAVAEIFCEEQLIARAQASFFVTGDFTRDDHPQPAF